MGCGKAPAGLTAGARMSRSLGVSERKIVVAKDGYGVDGLVEVQDGEASGVAGAEPGLMRREPDEPVVRDEDEAFEVSGEVVQKR